MKPEIVGRQVRTFPPGIVLEGPADEHGGRHVDYRPPDGGRAQSRLDFTGRSQAEVGGPVPLGREGEARVLKTLVAKLRAQGVGASLLPPEEADDEKGEDRSIQYSGEKVVVQVTMIPHNMEEFWRAAKKGSSALRGNMRELARWIREALQKKALLIASLLAPTSDGEPRPRWAQYSGTSTGVGTGALWRYRGMLRGFALGVAELEIRRHPSTDLVARPDAGGTPIPGAVRAPFAHFLAHSNGLQMWKTP